MVRLPPLKSLQAFRHAAEALSFKRAAEQLHVTPTAISQQIKSLESSLGVSLFRRKIREITLTPEGQLLLPEVSKAFLLLEEGVARLADDPHPDRLVLSSVPSFSARFLMPRLARLQETDEHLNVHLQASLGLSSFAGSGLDVAVRFGKGKYEGLEARHLLDDYVLPVCHPSLIDRERPVEAQLEQLPVLMDDFSDIEPLWQIFDARTGLQCLHSAARFKVSDANVLLEAVLGAQGLSLVRFSLVYELIAKGILCCPLPVYLDSPYQYHLVAPSAHFKRHKVRRFEHWLRDELKEIEEGWSDFHTNYLKGALPLNGLLT